MVLIRDQLIGSQSFVTATISVLLSSQFGNSISPKIARLKMMFKITKNRQNICFHCKFLSSEVKAGAERPVSLLSCRMHFQVLWNFELKREVKLDSGQAFLANLAISDAHIKIRLHTSRPNLLQFWRGPLEGLRRERPDPQRFRRDRLHHVNCQSLLCGCHDLPRRVTPIFPLTYIVIVY